MKNFYNLSKLFVYSLKNFQKSIKKCKFSYKNSKFKKKKKRKKKVKMSVGGGGGGGKWKIGKLLPGKKLNIKKAIKKYYHFTILIIN